MNLTAQEFAGLQLTLQINNCLAPSIFGHFDVQTTKPVMTRLDGRPVPSIFSKYVAQE
jgi:hypothetical protein